MNRTSLCFLIRPLAQSRLLWCAIVMMFGLFPLLSSAAEEKPHAVLSESAFDFGSVAQGTKVVREIEIKNTGTADLLIQRLSPSCGCTATTLTSSTVKPGTSEKIKITFDTTGFFGPKKKTIAIVTNDPENPEQVFSLTGHVATGITTSPGKLEFGEVFPSTKAADRTKEVSLEVEEGSSLEVARVGTLSKYLKVSPVVKQGGKATAQVELLSNAPRGDFRDRIVFEFVDDRRAPVNVPVTASVKGDLRVSPATVSFGVVEGAQVLERRVRFENKSAQRVSVRSIESSDPAVSASLVEVEPGKQGVVVIKVDPSRVRGDLKATVELNTSHPVENQIVLNVYGVQPPQ